VIGDKHIGSGEAIARRLRKTRSLQSQAIHGVESQSHDLPAFLVNPDRTIPALEAPSSSASDFRDRFSLLVNDTTGKLTPRYFAMKSAWNALEQKAHGFPNFWQGDRVRKHAAQFAFIALLFPFALGTTFGRAPSLVKAAPIDAHAQAAISAPVFDLDERLAFARALRERLLLNAIALSLKVPPPTEDRVDGSDAASLSVPDETQAPSPPDADMSAATQIAADNRTWSLPFGGRDYIPAELPITAAGSFRTETAISDQANDTGQRATVAEADVPAAAPAKKKKPQKITKRTKAVAQKRRPPAPVNQMTAAAQPVPVQQVPNLPPPPILFFLGAPPPSTQGQAP
jgi:hypothetical protein